eukprot:scaffold391313_cov16-Prasinocladus_malaysianus.AAC.1
MSVLPNSAFILNKHARSQFSYLKPFVIQQDAAEVLKGWRLQVGMWAQNSELAESGGTGAPWGWQGRREKVHHIDAVGSQRSPQALKGRLPKKGHLHVQVTPESGKQINKCQSMQENFINFHATLYVARHIV